MAATMRSSTVWEQPMQRFGAARRLAVGVTSMALAALALAIGTGSGVGGDCTGLNRALQRNLDFIAGQRANPDALSGARIVNRQAVVELIDERRAAAGCAR